MQRERKRLFFGGGSVHDSRRNVRDVETRIRLAGDVKVAGNKFRKDGVELSKKSIKLACDLGFVCDAGRSFGEASADGLLNVELSDTH